MLKLHCLKLKVHEEVKKSVRYQFEHFSSHAPRQPARPKMKQKTLDSRAKLQAHSFKRLSDIKYWWRDARGTPWAEHCGEPLKGEPLSVTSVQHPSKFRYHSVQDLAVENESPCQTPLCNVWLQGILPSPLGRESVFVSLRQVGFVHEGSVLFGEAWWANVANF